MTLTEEQILQFMKESGMSTHLEGLHDFPWSGYTYGEFKEAVDAGKVLLAILYTPDSRHIFLSKSEKAFSNVLGYLMFLVPIAFLIAAIWLGKYILLLGIVAFIIAAFVSNPWAASLRRSLFVLSVLGMVVGFIYNWAVGVIFAGFLISIILSVTSREYVNLAVKRRCLSSEVAFCFAYQSKMLLLKDTSTGAIFGG